jgi:hypothetical protein
MVVPIPTAYAVGSILSPLRGWCSLHESTARSRRTAACSSLICSASLFRRLLLDSHRAAHFEMNRGGCCVAGFVGVNRLARLS